MIAGLLLCLLAYLLYVPSKVGSVVMHLFFLLLLQLLCCVFVRLAVKKAAANIKDMLS